VGKRERPQSQKRELGTNGEEEEVLTTSSNIKSRRGTSDGKREVLDSTLVGGGWAVGLIVSFERGPKKKKKKRVPRGEGNIRKRLLRERLGKLEIRKGILRERGRGCNNLLS